MSHPQYSSILIKANAYSYDPTFNFSEIMIFMQRGTFFWLITSTAIGYHALPQAPPPSSTSLFSPDSTVSLSILNVNESDRPDPYCYSQKDMPAYRTTVEVCKEAIDLVIQRDGPQIFKQNQTFYSGVRKGHSEHFHELPDSWSIPEYDPEPSCEILLFGPENESDTFSLFDVALRANMIVEQCLKTSSFSLGGVGGVANKKFLVSVSGYIPRTKGDDFTHTGRLTD